jgi:hypothetical protein
LSFFVTPAHIKLLHLPRRAKKRGTGEQVRCSMSRYATDILCIHGTAPYCSR